MRTRKEQAKSLRNSLCEGYKSVAVHEAGYKLAMCHIEEAERRAEARVRAEIARDSERLDWLERGFTSCTVYMNGDTAFSPGMSVRNLKGRDFRSAIDAAREVV